MLKHIFITTTTTTTITTVAAFTTSILLLSPYPSSNNINNDRSSPLTVFAWANALYLKQAAMVGMGLGVGMFFTSYCLVVVEVLGLPLLTPMLSINGLFKSVIVIAFGPLIGKHYRYHKLANTENAVAVVTLHKDRMIL